MKSELNGTEQQDFCSVPVWEWIYSIVFKGTESFQDFMEEKLSQSSEYEIPKEAIANTIKFVSFCIFSSNFSIID